MLQFYPKIMFTVQYHDPYATYIVVCICDSLFSVFSKQIIL